MKIVQSFWSKPSLSYAKPMVSHRPNGGWLDRRHNYMSWALSCLQFCAFYDEVEIVTDNAGYDLLIRKLKLPYTKAIVVLDKLNKYDSKLWALGKIYTYSIQRSPFIHADGDIYIWEPLKESKYTAALFAQNIENGFSQYSNIVDMIKTKFHYIPNALIKSWETNKTIISVNAGLLGGNNIEFFKLYTRTARKFIDLNYNALASIDINLFNMVYEQCLFYAMSEHTNLEVCYQLDNVNERFDGVGNMIDAPVNVKYVHPISILKKREDICQLLSERLQQDYPEYYYRVINLLRTGQI